MALWVPHCGWESKYTLSPGFEKGYIFHSRFTLNSFSICGRLGRTEQHTQQINALTQSLESLHASQTFRIVSNFDLTLGLRAGSRGDGIFVCG